MGRLSRKLKKLIKNPVAVTSVLGGNLAAAKKALDKQDATEQGKIDRARAVTDAANAAAAAQTAEQQAAAAADVEYRGRLRQKDGLASTILNLGGATGDPNRPVASGLLGVGSANADSLSDDDPISRLKRKRALGL